MKSEVRNIDTDLQHPLWVNHKIGDVYDIVNIGGKIDSGWKIAYYPLYGTFQKNNPDDIDGYWVDFKEPRALIEKPIQGGTDFREVPLRYLRKALTLIPQNR